MRRLFLMLFMLVTLTGPAVAAPVLYDFSAPWCGPCQRMAPLVAEIEREGIGVRRIDVDREPTLAAQFHVDRIPCFVWVDAGREVHRERGVVSKEKLRWRPAPIRPPVVREKERFHEPHPAWRYERPIGYRAAVVRVDCTLSGRKRDGQVMHAWGSGTLVRWNGRLLVVTAKHVVSGAVKVDVYLHNRRKISARLVSLGTHSDGAVLWLAEDIPEITPAEVGDGALVDGDRLESCGYGSESKLAVNSGILLGFPTGRLIKISGYVREGDSGGGVFDSEGRLVGVISSGDDTEHVKHNVNAVDPQSIRALLDSATRQATEYLVGMNPDPAPLPLDEGDGFQPVRPAAPSCGPDCDDCRKPTKPAKPPAMGWRKSEIGRDQALEQEISSLRSQISGLQQAIANSEGGPTEATNRILNDLNARLAALEAQKAAPPAAGPADREKSPGNAIEQKLDDFLHKLPIQGPVTKLEEKQLESEHPLQRFFGATAAVVLLTVVGTVFLVLIGLVLHAVYKKCHSDAAPIAAKLAAIPGAGPALAAGFGNLDVFNTQLDAKIQAAVADLKAKLTPAAPAAAPAAPAVVNVNTHPAT